MVLRAVDLEDRKNILLWIDTPLCNRPSGIFILAGFSGKNHWVGQIPTGSA